MIKVRRIDKIVIDYESICKAILLTFICVLYAFYEKRIYVEMLYFALFLFYFVSRRKRLTIYALWNLFFAGICALSILWSYNADVSISMTRKMLELAIIGNLLIAFIDKKEKIIYLYKCFVIAGIALIIRLLISFPISMWGVDPLGDSALNANRTGLFLAISAICTMQLAHFKNKKIYYLLIFVFFGVIALTGSRKAFLMLLMGISALYYINSTKILKKVLSVFIILIIVITAYNIVMNVPELHDVLGVRLERMINTFTGEGPIDNSTRVRWAMIETGIYLFKNKPALGYGIASYSSVSGFGTYAHNNYIELLVGIGLIGTIIYYSIYVYAIIRLLNMKKTIYTNPLLIIIAVLAVMEYGLVSYYSEIYQILIALAIAAIKIMNQNYLQGKKKIE